MNKLSHGMTSQADLMTDFCSRKEKSDDQVPNFSPVVQQRFGSVPFPHLSSTLAASAEIQAEAVESSSSEVFSSTLKTLEHQIFVLNGQKNFSLDLSLLQTYISSSLLFYGMELEPTVFLLESESKAIMERRFEET